MMTDPIADMLTRIRNAQMARQTETVIPASKIKIRIAEILQSEGFIRGYTVNKDDKQGVLTVQIKYLSDSTGAISGLKRISKPSLRKYAGKDAIPSVRNGLGISIVSTSKGLMSDHEARRIGAGGEILCEVW
ncbi:MAG: 30S ribosomal protein S8 [Deltaproteobacteria bacterium]|nr:30S ribosomal protein S8 [Deltaproteobacteria bacterium]